MDQPGGWLWALIGLGVIALGVVLAWSLALWRRRRLSPAMKREQVEATKELYHEGEDV